MHRAPSHRARTRRASAILAAAALFLPIFTSTASASDATLRMGFSNLINGPLDIVTSPYTGGYILVTNLQEIGDSAGVRFFYAVPGYLWLVSLGAGGGFVRTATGAMEIVPGVLLFPFDQDMDELFDPATTAGALVLDWENPLAENEKWYVRYNPIATIFSIPLRFGLNYTRADY